MEKKPLRQITQYSSPFALCKTGRPYLLSVNDNQKTDTEIFAHLEYLSEIKGNGIKRLAEINTKNGTDETWKMFRSFVRQAKLFFFSARTQDPSISSLNYFYAFENLVKAYCCLYSPSEINNKISHGLGTGQVFSGTFDNQEITIQRNGIMPLFYELVSGQKITTNRRILNSKLVSYCADISYENELANANNGRKSLPMKATMGGETTEKISLLIAIAAPVPLLEKYPGISKVLTDNFNSVDITIEIARMALGIPLNEYKSFNYFQSKDDFKLLPTNIVSSDFYNKFSPFVSFYPRNVHDMFNINIPTEDVDGNEIIMNEYLAIFILMFYMSELVRYHPKTIQDNLSEPSGWLMERFTINTPQTFLRYMVNLIRGQDFIFD